MFPLRLTFVLVLILYVSNSIAVVNIIRTLLKDNVSGPEVIFKTEQWPFNPDDGNKRNPEFEALNGHRAYYLIERLGLGADGQQEERKYRQMIRDLDVTTTSYDQKPQNNPTAAPVPDFYPIYIEQRLKSY